MVQTLTDWLKQSRLIVVAVEMDKGRVRVKGDGEVCSDLSCGERRQWARQRDAPRLAWRAGLHYYWRWTITLLGADRRSEQRCKSSGGHQSASPRGNSSCWPEPGPVLTIQRLHRI